MFQNWNKHLKFALLCGFSLPIAYITYLSLFWVRRLLMYSIYFQSSPKSIWTYLLGTDWLIGLWHRIFIGWFYANLNIWILLLILTCSNFVIYLFFCIYSIKSVLFSISKYMMTYVVMIVYCIQTCSYNYILF